MYALVSQSNLKCHRCDALNNTDNIDNIANSTVGSVNNKCLKCRMKEYKDCSPPLIICNNCGQLDHLYCSYKAPELILEEIDFNINIKTNNTFIDAADSKTNFNKTNFNGK
jgi:hypothetical protein